MSAAIIEDYSYYLMMKFDYKFRTMLMIVPNLLSVVLSILAIYLFLILAIHALLETNDLAVGKDHRFKGRYDAEKNAVVISLEENEFENECQSKIGLNP